MWMQTSCAGMESQSHKCKSGYTVMACSPHSKKSGGFFLPTACFAPCNIPLTLFLQECRRVSLPTAHFAPCTVPLVLLSSGVWKGFSAPLPALPLALFLWYCCLQECGRVSLPTARFAPCTVPLVLLSSGAWSQDSPWCPAAGPPWLWQDPAGKSSGHGGQSSLPCYGWPGVCGNVGW